MARSSKKVGHSPSEMSDLLAQRSDISGGTVNGASDPNETRAVTALQQNMQRENVRPLHKSRSDVSEAVTVEKVAILEGIAPRTVRRRCDAGKYAGAFKCTMNGGEGWRIPSSALSDIAKAKLKNENAKPGQAIEQTTAPKPTSLEEYKTLMDAYDRKPPNFKRMAEKATAAVVAFFELRATGLSVATVEKSIAASHGTSKPTLWRHRTDVEGHDRQYWEALLCPRHHGGRGKSEFSPEAYEMVCRDFFIESQPPLRAILTAAREQAEKNGWKIPSDKTVMNHLKTEEPHYWIYREGGKNALERSFPTAERDYSSLRLHEMWESDGRRGDVHCIWPDGAKGRPVKVAWRECRTRMPLSVGVYKNEDAELVLNTLGSALELTGTRPENAKIDNGRAYANKRLTGQQKTRYRFKVKPDEPPGVFTRIKTNVRWSKPRRGRDKPIERFWRFIADHCDKLPQFQGAYCGSNTAKKPDNFDSDLHIPIEDYAKALKKAVWLFANTKHRGDGMNGMSPLDLYKQLSQDHQPNPVDPAIIRLCRMGVATVTPHKQTAELAFKMDDYGPVRYWSDELASLPMSIRGKKLHVYYDYGNARTPASVYDGEAYLCEVFNIEKIDFNEKSGEKVLAHVKAQANYLRPRLADLKTLRAGDKQTKTAINKTEENPFLLFFDGRITEPRNAPQADPMPESKIQPRPGHPGEHFHTETGEIYRGQGARTLTPTIPDGKELSNRNLEEMARRQQEKNLPAYLREQP
jgi:putative transposase